jgi:5-methyltetrahydrofolate--homocysteine methyltransferase
MYWFILDNVQMFIVTGRRKEHNLESQIKEIFDNIINGHDDDLARKIRDALDSGVDAPTILKEGMIAAMAEVGRLFEGGEFYVPEMLIAGRAMQAGLDLLKPYLLEADIDTVGRVVVGTVKGDLHDIGKNLVALMLEGAGFEVIDLGTDVAPDKFVEAAREFNPEVVGLSALLTTTMVSMQSTIEALKNADLSESVKVVVGGAPVTKEYAAEIGADGFALDASRAVALVLGLIKNG